MKLCLDAVKRTSTKGEDEMSSSDLFQFERFFARYSIYALFPQTANEIMYLGDD